MSISSILFVGIGGFIGAALRYIVATFIQSFFKTDIPIATLAINLLGCLAIGFIATKVSMSLLSPNISLFLITGILGGFTTFSTFSYDILSLSLSNHWLNAVIYTGSHIFLGIFFCFVGYLLAS